MASLSKTVATLGPATLVATQPITWRLISGVQPYKTTLTIHENNWKELEGQMGNRLILKITDSRGATTEIRGVYMLHLAPSVNPHHVSVVVADKRWMWQYKLIARDYNIRRKTGDRTAFGTVPQTQTLVDEYDYLVYSLDGEQQVKWTAKRAVEDVMEQLEGEGDIATPDAGGYIIESFPIDSGNAGASDGEFSLENVELRDGGDAALARMLAMVPGAEVYINQLGQAVIYDATDLRAGEEYFVELENTEGFTYSGQKGEEIQREWIRPNKVFVYYQREVECAFEGRDAYTGTVTQFDQYYPFIENVIPTSDPLTTIAGYSQPLPMGTYVPMDDWIVAMNADKPVTSLPWTWRTLRSGWVTGELDSLLGAGGDKDVDITVNQSLRIQKFKEHFRQTWRINKNFMRRIREIKDVRVALLDPVTGARAPAGVWGQAGLLPANKSLMHLSKNTPFGAVGRNINMLHAHYGGTDLIQTASGPWRLSIVDGEQGILKVAWIADPYGNEERFLPGLLVAENNSTPIMLSRNLMLQDEESIALNAIVEGPAGGIYLDSSYQIIVLLTIVPNGPNTLEQFHKEEVTAEDVSAVFTSALRITGGKGPDLHLFVSPSELTARFAWTGDAQARTTIQRLLGVLPGSEGIGTVDLPGFTASNRDRSLRQHAIATAAEALIEFADGVEGNVVTKVPEDGLQLKGNMSGVAIRVASYPSSKVDVVHTFPGKNRSISRFALMPNAVRKIVLRTL